MFDKFIQTFKVPDEVCDDLIKYFDKNKKLHIPGVVAENKVIKKSKASTDIQFVYSHDSCAELKKYVEEMVICFNQYKQIIPEIDLYCERFGLDTSINIQKYEKKEAFFDWHFENSKPYEKRIFVFMTYLNDVSQGGETAWYFQNVKMKPEKGLTVFWPADWMYLHRGFPPIKGKKYIITGWFTKV